MLNLRPLLWSGRLVLSHAVSWKRQTDHETVTIAQSYTLSPHVAMLLLSAKLPQLLYLWWTSLPALCHLQIDWICLTIKISVMGEQLRADCSSLGPRAARYEAIRVLRCQIFICLNQFAGCLWLCECVCVCKCTCTCVCMWNVKHPTSPVCNHESFDAFRVSVPEQFRG